jgi:c-di-GMP-binding flagellar brake protein YcgR
MSVWDQIHIKQRVEMTVSVMKQDYNFGSMIVRKNDNSIYFPMPGSQHSSVALKRGAPLNVTIHADDCYISFAGEVSAIHPGNPPTIQVNRPVEDQLRASSKESSYGLKDKVPLTYRILRDPVTPISDVKKGETVSISQSDAVIATIAKINPDSYVELTYMLPGDVQVSLVGKVAEVQEVKSGAQVSYETRVKYDIIRPGEQDKIVKYIFDKQRILRKKKMY